MRNGDEASQSRFRGQKIIESAIAAMVADVVTEAQEMARLIVEKIVLESRQLFALVNEVFHREKLLRGSVADVLGSAVKIHKPFRRLILQELVD